MISPVIMMNWTINDRPRSVLFDASINESHIGSAQVTEHQVETGSNVSDHVRAMPLRLSLQAMVSDTPLQNNVLTPEGGDTQRVVTIFNALTEAMQAGVLTEVNTSLKKYQNMAIVNLNIPRNADNSNASPFTIDLQQVRLVETVTVTALPERAKGPKKQGFKPAKDLDNKPKQKERVKSAWKALNTPSPT